MSSYQQLSPGVNFTEIDLTKVVPAVGSSVGAIACIAGWGPVSVPTLVESVADLVNRFGTPTNAFFEGWFCAASFLAYTNTLQFVRVCNTTSTNSSIAAYNALANVYTVSNIVAQTTKSANDYSNKSGTYDPNLLYIAKYPGLAGDSLRISVCDSANAYTDILTVNNSVATGTLNINVGANVATLITTTQGSGALSDAVALAIATTSNLAVGDLITVGNSTIGTQYVQISSIGPVINTSASNTATTINLVDPYRLWANWSNYQMTRYWEFHHVIGVPPGQSQYVLNNGNVAANDLMHIVIVDDGGYFSGEPGSILEIYPNVSRVIEAVDGQGDSIYYVTAVNQSHYVWWCNDRPGALSNTANNIASSSNFEVFDCNFNSGSDGASEANITISEVLYGYNNFINKETIEVDLVMTGKSFGGVIGEQIHNWISDNITTIRKDCVVFVSPNIGAVVNNYNNELTSLVQFRNQCRSSNYSMMDSGYKQIYDMYNNYYRWVPLNGDIAGLAAQVDETNAPWWAFSGFNRGNIKNVVKLAYNPGLADRNQLFPVGINPVVQFPVQGIVLFGDKTLQAYASAFDAINVRRLFITMEKALTNTLQYFLWEFNDSYTQAQVRNVVNPYLRIIQGGRGIYSFLCVCDGTNNTPDVVNLDILVVDVYVQPEHAIRNIQLNMVAVPVGVSFTEVLLPPL